MKVAVAATGPLASKTGIQIRRLNSTLDINGTPNPRRTQEFIENSIVKISGGDESLCQFESLDDQLAVVFYDPNRLTIETIEKNISDAVVASCVQQPRLD